MSPCVLKVVDFGHTKTKPKQATDKLSIEQKSPSFAPLLSMLIQADTASSRSPIGTSFPHAKCDYSSWMDLERIINDSSDDDDDFPTRTNISVVSHDQTTSSQTSSATISPVKMKDRNQFGRMERSRERNRIHARKTRQRKKEMLQTLQARAEELKGEQVQLKLSINEKNTASILCCLFSTQGSTSAQHQEDPRIEALLHRPTEEIPDPTKLPELPALILPGQHNSKKHKISDALPSQELPDDGIDYDLLGKDRSKCSPAELDQIRRERNRMHAKRTRDRKRLFMDEMADMCKQLEGENALLQRHLDELNGEASKQERLEATFSISPSLPPTPHETLSLSDSRKPKKAHSASRSFYNSQNEVTYDQIKTLLEAAGSFQPTSSRSPSVDVVSASSEANEDNSTPPFKRRKLDGSTSTIPTSITTSNASNVLRLGL